jgi:signal transduction histidine kinase
MLADTVTGTYRQDFVAWLRTTLHARPGITLSAALAGLFQPGESVEASVSRFAEALRRLYGAAAAIVVLEAEGAPSVSVSSGPKGSKPQCRRIDADSARMLLALQPDQGLIFGLHRWPPRRSACAFFDAATFERRRGDEAAVAKVARLLEGVSFLSFPLRSRSQPLGRLYVVSSLRHYGARHLRDLAQIAAQVAPSIESGQLVERLSRSVATQERRRISRDLHDGTVQPYIGLKLGLEALRRKVLLDERLARELDELIQMAGHGIAELREYVGRLKNPGTARGAVQPLAQGLRHELEKFCKFYDFHVDFTAETEIRVSSQLYEEMALMLGEALSNVRRHAAAPRARVELRTIRDRLVLEIANPPAPESEPHLFHPRSIAERAQDLGGWVRVRQRPGEETAVLIEVPF